MLNQVQSDLKKLAVPKKSAFFPRFFKTGKGEYGEGDIFLGVTVPNIRIIASKYKDLTFQQAEELLHSKIHEVRMVALLILVSKFKKVGTKEKKTLYKFYLANTKYVNNWDLVDLSCTKIVGTYLLDKDRRILEKLASSKSLWERRIAIISTYAFLQKGESADTYKIAKILLNDPHDLVHKAVGWMLREAGKRVSEEELKEFLKANYKQMPRTALRYAIERFPEPLRRAYIVGRI